MFHVEGWADGRTDSHSEASSRFPQFCKRAEELIHSDGLVLLICVSLEMSYFIANGNLWEPSSQNTARYHKSN